jgi:ribosome-binding protein aMBF1 (putative translation factor)
MSGRFDCRATCPAGPPSDLPRRGSNPDPVAVAFGAAIRRAREARDESLETVADRIPGRRPRTGEPISMDGRYLGEIELGWHAPNIVTAKRIADALEVTLAELVSDL